MISSSSSRVFSRGLRRVVALCAVSVGLFWSCRTVDDEAIVGAETYQAALPDIGAAYKIPQNARWRIGRDSGEAGLYKRGLKVVSWVDLDTIPMDTVWIEYWRAGVREQVSAFLFKGTARLEWSGLSLIDSVVVEFLRRIDPSMDSSRFDTAFATALVDNDPLLRGYGFPQRSPVGMDTAEVLRIAMVLMVRKERALAQIAPKSDWALGIDTLAVHVRVRKLCEEGVVTDTSKIFPHPIVPRDTTKPDTGESDTTEPIDTLARPDTSGPDLRIVEPVAETTLEYFRDSIEVRVRATDTSGVDSVLVNRRRAVRRDSFWLAGKLFVPTLPDSLVLLVEAWDGAKNRSTVGIRVRRKAPPPPMEPYHSILLPAESSVPFDSATVLARWIVYDPASVVDSVRIGGVEAVYEKDSTWSARVRLDSIGTPTTIRFAATTAKGTSIVDSLAVTRRKDAIGPAIRFVGPADKQVFGYTEDSVTISVAVTDPSGVAAVRIAGTAARDSGGRYQRRVGLALAETDTFVVEASDSVGNLSRASIALTRQAPPDTLPPEIQRIWPLSKSGTSVPFDSQTVTLRWVVTDWFGLPDSSVRIGGIAVKGVRDTFALRVPLPPSGTPVSISLVAVNAKGVSIADTVAIARAKDTAPPVVVRKAGSRTVPFDSVSVVASWEVSDNHKLSSVAIGGDTVSGVGGLYRRTVALDTGRNLVAIVAVDSTGNRTSDTLEVFRVWKDTIPPVIVRRAGTQSHEVDFDSSRVKVSWKVTDHSPVTVTINGKEIIGSEGIYTDTITLSSTVTTVKIAATDTTDNTSSDTVTITKGPDLRIPELKRTMETRSRTVDFQTTSIRVGWVVNDNGTLRTVNIAGEIFTQPTDSAYTRMVPLEVGDNVIRIEARDQVGNPAFDSVVIHRLPASTPTRLPAGTVASVVVPDRATGLGFGRFPLARRERIFG